MNNFPFTDIQIASVQMHELFTAWVDAGFTREEALQLLISSIIQAGKNND